MGFCSVGYASEEQWLLYLVFLRHRPIGCVVYLCGKPGATENARLENPAPNHRGGKRRNKLYGQPMGQFLQVIEITVSLIL